MSTSIDYVVDREASPRQAPPLAKRVVKLLLERGIIVLPRRRSARHPAGPEYVPGPNVREAAEYNEGPNCGLDVLTGRRMFDNGENGVDALRCPSCNKHHRPNQLEWITAIDEWRDETGPAVLTCRKCKKTSSVADWEFEPAQGFGNLAFQFTEWLLKEEFVQEMQQALGHRVAWVKFSW